MYRELLGISFSLTLQRIILEEQELEKVLDKKYDPNGWRFFVQTLGHDFRRYMILQYFCIQ
jgi:hypothetical protein